MYVMFVSLCLQDVQGAISYGSANQQSKEQLSSHASIMIIADMVMQHLGPLLTSSYVTEACFVPFLEKICNECALRSALGKKSKLMNLLDILWAFLEVK